MTNSLNSVIMCYKLRQAIAQRASEACEGGQAFDALSIMSMETDRSECECAIDCEMHKHVASNVYNKLRQAIAQRASEACEGGQAFDAPSIMSIETDRSECECAIDCEMCKHVASNVYNQLHQAIIQ